MAFLTEYPIQRKKISNPGIKYLRLIPNPGDNNPGIKKNPESRGLKSQDLKNPESQIQTPKNKSPSLEFRDFRDFSLGIIWDFHIQIRYPRDTDPMDLQDPEKIPSRSQLWCQTPGKARPWSFKAFPFDDARYGHIWFWFDFVRLENINIQLIL